MSAFMISHIVLWALVIGLSLVVITGWVGQVSLGQMAFVTLLGLGLTQLVGFLLFINITWGLVNLLPIYPLDGGQIARQLLMLNDPSGGARRSIILSIVVGAAMSFLGFAVWRDNYVGFMFAMLAVSNYQSLRGGW